MRKAYYSELLERYFDTAAECEKAEAKKLEEEAQKALKDKEKNDRKAAVDKAYDEVVKLSKEYSEAYTKAVKMQREYLRDYPGRYEYKTDDGSVLFNSLFDIFY